MLKKSEKTCLQLKADFFPMMVLKIAHYDLEAIQTEMDRTVKKAPKQFAYAPMIIDVNDLDQTQSFDMAALCRTLREQKIIPIGIRGLKEEHHDTAIEQGLAIVSNSKPVEPANNKAKKVENMAMSQLITKPIRAGTHVYAKNTDLVISASVNAGGECIADGNIHIYGPLRGRALAGATGNTQARIFCKTLDAELISIAGHYLVKEDIKLPEGNPAMIQIYLENGKIKIEEVI